MKKNNFLSLLLLAAALFAGNSVRAQYYQASGLEPGNPGGLNTDSDFYFATQAPPAGSTILYSYKYAKDYTLQYLATQTIPFTFDFNGSPVTQYKISTSGYVTFTTSSPTPVGPINTSLPNASLPDKTICTWGFTGAAGGGFVYTKVYGTSPHQQLWIDFCFAGDPADTNSQNMFAIVLEQTTNNIYLVDQWGNIVFSNSRPYIPINLTLGVQVNATTAYQVAASPKVNAHTWTNANTDNIYYEFSPTQANAYTAQVKFPLLEEFMQASCGPCFEAAPNIDSVLTNCKSFCNPIRYHTNWPGVDYMNDETQDSVVGPRVSPAYYNIQGVPDSKLDGVNDVYPGAGGLSSIMLNDERFIGSPFQITLKDSFDVSTETYYATGTIKTVHTFAAGLIAQAVLTVDTIKYNFDQSTEDPNNNSPFLLKFPQVAEEMMSSSNGTTLAAFTAIGQTQTVKLSWQKNHAWGAYVSANNCYCYDSTNTHITFFVQDNSNHYVYQSVSAAPGQTVSTPYTPPLVTAVSNMQHTTFNLTLYPNPAGNYTNIVFNLDEQANVSMQVINLLGQSIYSSEKGVLPSGQHTIQLNTSSLQAGIYFVKLSTDNNTEVQKLVIEK